MGSKVCEVGSRGSSVFLVSVEVEAVGPSSSLSSGLSPMATGRGEVRSGEKIKILKI